MVLEKNTGKLVATDGELIGTWDPVTADYVTLPGSYSRTLQKAMEMATRMRPVQLISLPIGRIER